MRSRIAIANNTLKETQGLKNINRKSKGILVQYDYSMLFSFNPSSISIQDQLADQRNVGLTKQIRLLSRFVAPKRILLIPFITASNLSRIGINSSTSSSLLIALTDSFFFPSPVFLLDSQRLTIFLLVFTSLVFLFFVSFLF